MKSISMLRTPVYVYVNAEMKEADSQNKNSTKRKAATVLVICEPVTWRAFIVQHSIS